jgi:hypothetical protein
VAVGVSPAGIVSVAASIAGAAAVDVAAAVAAVGVAVSVICAVAVPVGWFSAALLVGGATSDVLVGAGAGALVDSFGSFVGGAMAVTRRVGEGTVCATIELAQVAGPMTLAATVKIKPAITKAAIKRCVFMPFLYSSLASHHIEITFD